MDLQAGLETSDRGAPLHSEDAVLLSPTVAAERHDGRLLFYNASGPIYSCPEADGERVRLGAAVLLSHELDVRVDRLAEVLGVSRTTLWRWRKRYEAEGVDGVRYNYEGRPPHKLVGERRERAQALLTQGASNTRAAEAAGVSEGAIRLALRSGRLVRPSSSRESEPSADGTSRRERSEADREAGGGVAVRRRRERALAAAGELEEAPPRFERADSVARGGVLVALPVLVAQGAFEAFERVYGKLEAGFYGLNAVVATVALMALLRIKTPNQLPAASPGEFGRLLGLDRVPEVKTLRRKLAELGSRARSLELVEAFARRWIEERGEEVAGVLYVDGHVRPYHGRAHTLPKTWVARRGRAMAATTDYWVHDTYLDPWFFVTAPANDGLLSMLDGEILPEIRELVGRERPLTVVLDREGWSPKRFRRWAEEEGVHVLTYRKGRYEAWPEERFPAEGVEVAGRTGKLRLVEDTLELSNGFEVREVRCLDEKGHQVSLVTTRWDLTTEEVAARMFARWGQENFFRYMRHEFALDLLPTLAVEPADPDRTVPSPAQKEKTEAVAKLGAELAGLHEALGKAVATGEPDAADDQELTRQIAELERTLAATKEERAELPERVPLRELMDPEDIVQLERERKRITDVIKMAAYRAESELADLLGPALGRHHQDEARGFLKRVFQLPADLVPDEEARRLRVRLHGMANPRSNRALAALCDLLRDYDVTFPGTSLRIILEPPPSQS